MLHLFGGWSREDNLHIELFIGMGLTSVTVSAIPMSKWAVCGIPYLLSQINEAYTYSIRMYVDAHLY